MTKREINAIHSACFRRSWDDDTDDASRLVLERSSQAMTALKSQVKDLRERLARQALHLERAEAGNERFLYIESMLLVHAKVPFGWRLDKDGVKLIPVAEEQRVIEQITKCRAAGMSWHSIALIMSEKGGAA